MNMMVIIPIVAFSLAIGLTFVGLIMTIATARKEFQRERERLHALRRLVKR